MTDEKSIFQKIGDAIADYAPGLAGVLTATGIGAPAAVAVGAVGALAKAFGLGSDATPEAVLSAVTTDPQAALKAMIANQEFELKKRDQDIEVLKATQNNLTERHKADMSSDSWLSKNVRPLCLLAFTAMIAAATFLPPEYISQWRYEALREMGIWIYGYYFVGRTVEKDPLARTVGSFKGGAK